MRILITGGAGFIGSSVADRLLHLGHQVFVIDNYETGRRENNAPHPDLTIAEGSVSDELLVRNVFRDFVPEAILHAAASYKNPDNWKKDIETNVIGTINLAEVSRESSTKKFIYLQTSLCYGVAPTGNPITVGHPYFGGSYHGGSSYAISKSTGELYLELTGRKFISFRLANIFGPRSISGPIPAFYKNLTEGKTSYISNTKRDFVYIDDLVKAIELALLGDCESGYYNIASGRDIPIKDIFFLMARELTISDHKMTDVGKSADDTSTILLDPSLSMEKFGWKASTSIEAGIKQTIAWYKESLTFPTYTHLKLFSHE